MLTFFYKYHQKCYSQYPTRDDVGSVVNELIPQMLSLNGKQQLYIRRSGDNGSVSYVLYSHVLDDRKGLLGICIVFDEKKFPCNINYLFEFFESQFATYIKDGKLLHFDSVGGVAADNSKAYEHSALIHLYSDRIVNNFNLVKANFVKYPQTYYGIAKSQTIVLDFSSCETSTIKEIVKYNNIIVITRVTENENFYNSKNLIIRQRKENENLITKLESQKEQYNELLKEKNRYKYVIALIILLLLSGICIYAISHAKKQEKHQFEVKEKAMTDSITKKDSVIIDIRYDLTEKAGAYDSLQQQHNNLQNSYNDLVQKKTQLEKEISEIRDNVSAGQPFVVISTNYNKSAGNLTVTYLGLVSGSYTITIKALYDNSSYDCGKHSVSIEKGKHSCVFHIGKRQSKKFALLIGKKVVGGEIN